MKRAMLIALGVVTGLALPALAQETSVPARPAHHHHVRHNAREAVHRATIPAAASAQVAPPAPAPVSSPFSSFFPHIAPYANGQGDEDGLSRDINDCNKGCIGGNPG